MVYDPPKPKKIKLTDNDLYNADLFGFGSKIGQITNKSTSAYALLDKFEKNSKEHKELINRLKMCIKLQSQQIDKTKIGREVKGIPKSWINFHKIDDDDTDDLKEYKEFQNSILLDKHPYFFRYLYRDTDKKYKNYVKQMDNKFKSQLGMSLDELLNKENLTSAEIDIIDGYKKFIPVIDSDSVMNNLCKHIENFNFDIKNKKKAINLLDVHPVLMRNEKINKNVYKKVLSIYKKLNKKRQFEYDLNILVMNNDYDAGFDEDLGNVINNKFESFKDELLDTGYDIYDIMDCLIYIMYIDYPKSNKVVLWETFGEEILKTLIFKYGNKIKLPMPNVNGNIEYLNNKFILEEVLL